MGIELETHRDKIRSCLSPVFFAAIVGLRHMFGRVRSLWASDYSTVLCV